MAAFKDNPLKQVVDDLNIQNASTIPAPLTEDICELLNPIQDGTLGSFANTRATLKVNANAVGYPVGQIQVKYRRLVLDTLYDGLNQNLLFIGLGQQTVTLEDILKKLDAGTAAYLLPLLVDQGPYVLTRDVQQIDLIPKTNSLVLDPQILVIQAATTAVDIATFPVVDNINPFTTYDPVNFPFPGVDATLDEIKELIVARIFRANTYTTPLAIEDMIIEPLVDDGMEIDTLPKYGAAKKIRVTVIGDDNFYKGTNVFRYYLRDPIYTIDPNAVGQVVLTMAPGQSLREAAVAAINAKGSYANLNEFLDTGFKLVRDADFTYADTTTLFGTDDSWVFAGGRSMLNAYLKVVTPFAIPFEEIYSFAVDTAGIKRLYGSVTNLAQWPLTVELLEKPAEFAPTTLDINPATAYTLVSLPVGNYKVRITRTDSYKSQLQHKTQPFSLPEDVRITEVHKAKGHILAGLYGYQAGLTTIHEGAFDEAIYCYNAYRLFGECPAISSLPEGLFDNMTNCYNWEQCLSGTTALRVVPDELFGFLKVVKPNCTRIFGNAGPDHLPGTLFKNARWLQMGDLMNSCSMIKTVGAQFIKNMNIQMESASFGGMFFGCSALQEIPVDIFDGIGGPNNTLYLPGDTTWYWSFMSTFSRCTSLTSIPEGLFDPIVALGINANSTFQTMFSECSALTTLPSGMFRGMNTAKKYWSMAGLFYNCGALTTLPEDLFDGFQLYGALGDPDNYSSQGAFQSTGLTAIPENLLQFGDPATISGVRYAFAYTKISTIPAGLFANCPALKDLQLCFMGCSLLTNVPVSLFQGCPNVLKMEGVFRTTPLLTSVPAGLLDPCTKTTTMVTLFWECGITAIPPGLFDQCVALENVESMFLSSGLVGPIDNVFINQPALTNAINVFGTTKITSAGSNVLSGAPEIVNVRGFFSYCKQLATVHKDIFKFNTKITNANSMFFSTEALTTVDVDLFNNQPLLADISLMFGFAKGLTTLPEQLFNRIPFRLVNISQFATRCDNLEAIPYDFFSGGLGITNAGDVFSYCPKITKVPTLIFGNMQTCTNFSSAFKGCTLLNTIENDLFAINSVPCDISNIFSDCPALTVVPDGIFFALKNITKMNFAFLNCPALTTVGRLVANELSTKIEIGGILGGDLVGTGPSPYPDLTVADNLITSTIAMQFGAYGFILPFNRRNLFTKNIDNLFGANCRFVIATFETKGYFANMKVTGNGTNFIAKHQVPTTSNGFFTGSTTLSDYATLPAWAKA